MKFTQKFFHCGEVLAQSHKLLTDEVYRCVNSVKWVEKSKKQAEYNKLLEKEFIALGWETQPLLLNEPRLIGDFRKHLVFVEVQFGNSATLYRDYYKFQYGLANGLLSLAVLIVPTSPAEFFPSRPRSVNGMAEYSLAERYFTLMPINVPTLLIGLLPAN